MKLAEMVEAVRLLGAEGGSLYRRLVSYARFGASSLQRNLIALAQSWICNSSSAFLNETFSEIARGVITDFTCFIFMSFELIAPRAFGPESSVFSVAVEKLKN
jgi:hypothetical protein